MSLMEYFILISWAAICAGFLGHHWLTSYFEKKGELIKRLHIQLREDD